MARIRGVTLDAAGTLIAVRRPVGDTYAELARAYGGVLDRRRLDAAFHAIFPSMPPLAFAGLSGAALASAERDWWRQLVRRVVTPAGGVPEFDAYFEALYAHFAAPQAWRSLGNAPRVLATLRDAGLRLAVVSNFDSRLPGILDGLGIGESLDALLWSSAAGAAKPVPRIFEAALEALRLAPEEALHVGDRVRIDVAGARAAGMGAVLVDHGECRTEDVVRITDIGELPALVLAHRD